MKIDRRALLAALGCGVFAVSYGTVMKVRRSRRKLRYQPHASTKSGSELVLVFIGSFACGACHARELPGIVERLKLLLFQRAQDRDLSFAAIGIAADADPDTGMGFLRRFGHFDEIMCGRTWFGLGCRRYLQEIPGPAATPQMVVVSRRLIVDRMGTTIRDEHAVLRKVGLTELRDWLELGAPIPTFDAPTLATEVSK